MLFVIERHEEHGNIGLRPKCMPHADPFTGFGVIHDLIEHQRNDDGSTEAELMAFGAMLLVREDSGYHMGPRAWSAEYDIGGGGFRDEWDYHLHRHNRHPDDLREPPRVTNRDALERTYRVVRACARSLRNETRWDDNRVLPSTAWWIKAAKWMAHGYQKAKRRYRHMQAYDLGCLFRKGEHVIDKFIEHHECYEGAEVEITLNIRKGHISIKMLDDPGY